MTCGLQPHHLRLTASPVYSYMYISNSRDMAIPVKRVRLNPSTGQLEEAPARPLFLKGPIPLDWLSQAAQMPGKALALGLALWWLHGMSKGAPFKLSKKATDLFDISRDAGYDALRRLESAGLISVIRARGQRPTVKVLISKPAQPPIRAPNPKLECPQDDGLSVKKSKPLRASLYSDVTQRQSSFF